MFGSVQLVHMSVHLFQKPAVLLTVSSLCCDILRCMEEIIYVTDTSAETGSQSGPPQISLHGNDKQTTLHLQYLFGKIINSSSNSSGDKKRFPHPLSHLTKREEKAKMMSLISSYN